MRYANLVFAAFIATSLSAPVLADGLPTQKVLTIDVAETIAHEALMKCRADGYKVVVQVFDAGNTLKAFLREDGSFLGSIDVSRMKAFTVLAFNRPSSAPPKVPEGRPVPAPLLPQMLYAEGGLPIKAGDQTIGAVGISGAPGGEKDAACAEYGLSKVVDMLK